MIRSQTALAAACLVLAACAPSAPAVGRFDEPAVDATGADIPAGADPDACYGRDVRPAVIETVTERMPVAAVRPQAATAYRVVRRERIVRERQDLWFRTPCPDAMTPDFVAALQRALAVRGHFDGPATGTADAATARAVRAFQRETGLDSSVLSIAAAKRLGLVAYDRAEALGQE